MYIYIIYIYIYDIYIYSNQGKNILKVKTFRLLPLSIHNIFLNKFRFESHIRLDYYRARYKVVQGTSRTRFNFW